MAAKILPTPEELREVFAYDPETGIVTNKVTRQYKAKQGMEAGNLCAQGYRTLMFRRKNYRTHVIAWVIQTGHWPDKEIDHIDGNRSNNKWKNLRLATRAQNCLNVPMHRDNATGFKGVTKEKRTGRYIAQIFFQGKHHHIGAFRTPEEASLAYQAKSKELHGEFGRPV